MRTTAGFCGNDDDFPSASSIRAFCSSFDRADISAVPADITGTSSCRFESDTTLVFLTGYKHVRDIYVCVTACVYQGELLGV